MFYDGTEWGTLSFTKKLIQTLHNAGTAVAADAQTTVPFTAYISNGGLTITLYTATSNPELLQEN
jgi:hypothetical protein